MFWHKDMACGVHLGILLMCLVQAEHVRCLWAAEAQSSQGQSSNRYVGFSQQDSGLKRFGGSYPQNQLRQASPQSSSFNTDTAVSSSSYSQGLSNRGYAQTPSKPAQSGYPSVKLAQSSLLSKPNSQTGKAQEVPKRRFTGLSTAIASGSSVSQHNKKQNDLTDISKKSTRPGTLRASKYPSSSSASVQSPSSKSKLASHQLIAQKASSAAETQAYYGQRAAPAKSSSLFSPVSPEQQKSPVRVKTSATAPARRVSLNRGAKASKPSRFSPQNERFRNNPSQNEAGNPYGSKRFPVPGGNSKESYRPTSTSNQQNSRLGSQPRSLQMPTNERLSYKPSYPSTGPIPSSTSSLQTSWNSRNSAQGVPNLPASGNGRAGTSAQKFAPTRTYNIPQRFGGFSIRRLKEPADEKQVGVRKSEQTYTAPPQQSLNIRKPQQTYTAPPQQTYTAPPQQRLNIRKPQQTYTAPPQQTYMAPPQQSLNIRKPQQTYMAPSQQSVSLQPQAESVHPPSTWKRFKPHSGK